MPEATEIDATEIDATEIEAIERATVAAVAPERVDDLGGWLVCRDPGGMGRATSAVPLRHDAPLDPALLDRIEALYRSEGCASAFRIADDPRLEPVREALARRGFRPEQPTLVKIGLCEALAALSDKPAAVTDAPDEAWAAAFQGEGFDPVDAAARIRNLSRSPGAVFASVREEGEALAVGVAAFAHGWVSVHGMRTSKARRGEGLAGRVLAGLAQAGAERGLGRVFLQVEEPNAPARALYRRAGMRPVWRYRYWR